MARSLAVVGWQTEVAEGANSPDEASNRDHDGSEFETGRSNHTIGECGTGA